TFTGATDVLARGVSIETAATLTLDGVTIANNSAAPPWHWDSDDPGPAAVVATGGPALTVTSSTVTGTVFGGGILDHAPSGSLTVQDAMITGNTGIGTAGGIAALGRHLTIADTTVADNHPPEVQVPDGPVTTFDRLELDEDDLARAGGVYAPSVTAERVRIERNAGYDTGGIEASAIALTDAHIRHNVGTITGGVTAGPGSSVVRATIEENIGELVGGGLRADTWCTDTCPSTVTVSDSLVRANASVYGGGAATVTQRTGGTVTFPPGDTLVLHQVSIVDNVAETGNSLMVAGGTTAVVESATMTGGHPLDDAEGTPADIGEVYIFPTPAPILTITDTVVATDGAHAACALTAGAVTSGGGNVVSDGTCGLDEASDLSGVGDVGLGPLADNGGPTLTRLPAPGSPLLDRAVGTCGPADQRGLPRPQGPACDTGAVERPLGGFHPMPPTRVLDSRDGTGGWTTPLGAG
ncbi:MAG: hypothetical protein KDB33_16420, partial [Acidimicrobiales bacterium]|nr:hypothetical protein [Acidimicrobiales bacterium]